MPLPIQIYCLLHERLVLQDEQEYILVDVMDQAFTPQFSELRLAFVSVQNAARQDCLQGESMGCEGKR